MEDIRTKLKMIKMSDIEAQEIEWLWYPYIAYGKLAIVQGDPGDGKTTLILNLAAKLTKGEGLDENMKVTEPMNVIYQTAEDGLADTVKPRLLQAGADCEKVLVIDESEKSLVHAGRTNRGSADKDRSQSSDSGPDTGLSGFRHRYEPGQ